MLTTGHSVTVHGGPAPRRVPVKTVVLNSFLSSSTVGERSRAPTVAFAGLPPGVYAVTMFHDERGTGAPEMNFLGMPKSGIGLSNNPVIVGPPTFAKSRFAVPATTRITIEARYLF